MSLKPEERAKQGVEGPIPEMNQNIIEYIRPDESMFENAVEEIEDFQKKFDL